MLTTRRAEPQHGETFYNGSLEPLLETLALEGVEGIYLDGGNAVRQGLEAGVVDDMTIGTLPIVLGSGIKLFEGGLPTIRWTLVSSRSFGSGLVQATYQRRRDQFCRKGFEPQPKPGKTFAVMRYAP